MTKQQIQIAIIIIGSILLVVLIGRHMAGGKGGFWSRFSRHGASGAIDMGAGKVSGAQETVTFDLPPLSEEIRRKQHIAAESPWGRDPFTLQAKGPREPESPALPLAGVTISAVVMRGESGMALIDDDILRPGDNFRGYQVIQIDRSGMVLEKEGERVVIPYAK